MATHNLADAHVSRPVQYVLGGPLVLQVWAPPAGLVDKATVRGPTTDTHRCTDGHERLARSTPVKSRGPMPGSRPDFHRRRAGSVEVKMFPAASVATHRCVEGQAIPLAPKLT